jgi:hypothetical protein
MGANYYNGGGPARITGDKLPHVFQDNHLGLTVALMNNVFDIYYKGYHALDNARTQASGTKLYKKLDALNDKILADLRDAASEKSMANAKIFGHRIGGAGQSLYDVFQDLEKNNGVLKDDTNNGNNSYKAPAGVFTFQEQMLIRGSDIAKSYAQFNAWKSNMEQWKLKASWDDLGGNLDKGGKVIEYIGPKLWCCVGASEKQAGAFNATAVKWWGYGAKVKTLMDSYVAVQSSPNSRRQLIAEVAGFVVDGLPVFGSLYGGVIRAIPQAMQFFEDYAKRTQRAIEGKV